jgi:hypothetical protein
VTNPIKIYNIPVYFPMLFLDGLGRGDGGQAILGVKHFKASMVAGFDYLGGEYFRNAILRPIDFLGSITLMVWEGRVSGIPLLFWYTFRVLGLFDGSAWKNRWDTVLGQVFLVSLGCKVRAEEEGNEGQDMGFHGGNIWIYLFQNV